MSEILPFDVLARCPLFAELPDADVEALAVGAQVRDYEEGSMLFFAGDVPEGLHVVARGRVRIHVISPESGREVVLAMEHPYQSVAELPSFDGGDYPAHGQAVEATTTVFIPQDHLEAVLAARPALARHLLRTLGRRLRKLVGLLERLSFQEVVHRLAGYLRERSAAGVPFDLETNGAIAARIGTVPELVSRNLSRLVQAGAVELDGRTVVAVDVAELAGFAEAAGR